MPSIESRVRSWVSNYNGSSVLPSIELMIGQMCMVHVGGSLAEPIHLVERNQKGQELIRDSLLEGGRWNPR